ncbi:transcriptional regulator [Marinobacterium zhoushanense]|uniref:Transcriptional regulator n=1 Tax=Marinobacterium zhoushanense TaxID=1679163 RepID=A0ABQ1JZ32_9GAMM|nr:LysR family transcriptional regulator [Marinobacterium zhoushanense]GGB81865.1 transcriptional regulator [Marinobacterium zhoushanense]
MERLNDITVFIQVVESGSFTLAAEKLGISKSVVSKYVTRLENGLGARLLNRSTRRLSLTEVGRNYFEQCKYGLEAIERAEAEVTKLQKAPLGVLRVNVPMSFGILHIAPLLPEFQQKYPGVTVDMVLEDRQVDLIDEGVDLAIRIAEMTDSSLVARRLGPCRHVVCASPAYLAENGIPSTPEELQVHNAICYRYHDSPTSWRFIDPDGAHISVQVSGSIQVNNSLALKQVLLAGGGIALTPTFVVGDELRTGTLQEVVSRYRKNQLSIYAVYPQRRHLSPKVTSFVDFLAERISEYPTWDQSHTNAVSELQQHSIEKL